MVGEKEEKITYLDAQKMALNFYAQNQILWTTVLLTVIFGAFTLLELIRQETGGVKSIVLTYYVLLSIFAGFPVSKLITNMRMANSKMEEIGMWKMIVNDAERHDPFRVGLWLARHKATATMAWIVTSVLVGFLGVAIAFL